MPNMLWKGLVFLEVLVVRASFFSPLPSEVQQSSRPSELENISVSHMYEVASKINGSTS